MNSLLDRPGASRGKVLLSLIMICIIGVISSYIYCLAVYVTPLNEAHGWAMGSIVLTYSIAMFISPFAYAIGGGISAKFGRKRTLVATGVIYGLAILASGLTANLYVFMVCQGVICSLSMYCLFMCQIELINVIWPERKSTVMGLMYGCSTFGGALLAPAANFFIERFSVSTALVIQGGIFAAIMFICCMLVWDPTAGDKQLAEKLDAESAAVDAAAAAENPVPERPSMPVKKIIRHPSIYLYIISIICIQLIGNLLVTDASVIAVGTFEATATQAAFCVSLLNIGAGFGGIVCGAIGDKLGHFKTTLLLGVFDGVFLAIFAFLGNGGIAVFMAVSFIVGFTYNGITALNPAMITEAWGEESLGTTMAIGSVGTIIVAIVGPQLGLMVSFAPMMIICAAASVVGGLLAIAVAKSANKYYKNIGSDVTIR